MDFITKDDERRLEAAEMWCYRRMLRISWTDKRTNKGILEELQAHKKEMHSRNDTWEKKKGALKMQYIDNIKKWTRASLEENVRLTEDRTAWRERSCAAGAANVRTDDAD